LSPRAAFLQEIERQEKLGKASDCT
jgi:hypothetical protein